MNARVDPETLYVAKPGDEDTALIALCRVALRALDREIKLFDELNALTERYDNERPPYPRLPWMYGFSTATAQQLGSARLREYRDGNLDKTFRANIGKQIAAVVAWERACAALSRSLGLDKADRRYRQAIRGVADYVGLIPAIEATTLQGASYKSLVMSTWLTAGYEFEDIGRELATSILDDVHRLGADGSQRRRPTRGSARAELH